MSTDSLVCGVYLVCYCMIWNMKFEFWRGKKNVVLTLIWNRAFLLIVNQYWNINRGKIKKQECWGRIMPFSPYFPLGVITLVIYVMECDGESLSTNPQPAPDCLVSVSNIASACTQWEGCLLNVEFLCMHSMRWPNNIHPPADCRIRIEMKSAYSVWRERESQGERQNCFFPTHSMSVWLSASAFNWKGIAMVCLLDMPHRCHKLSCTSPDMKTNLKSGSESKQDVNLLSLPRHLRIWWNPALTWFIPTNTPQENKARVKENIGVFSHGLEINQIRKTCIYVHLIIVFRMENPSVA